MEANGSRLSKLIINKVTQALRETLQSLIKPSNLAAKFNDPSTKKLLKSLQHKVISSGDWNCLYPAVGSPDVENFSIAILFTLLRNMWSESTFIFFNLIKYCKNKTLQKHSDGSHDYN